MDTPLRKMGETGIGVGTKPVEIQNLSFNYVGDGKPVLTVDEFHVEEGEAVLVIGKSGGGKSTLVNCVNGVIPHVFK
ncbi:MAG: ATP-binding cassette domain-containing protein, partial [Nitrososphaerota archaeon]|nr:ATP-binding cassette domain-containing protein [Nitrososphaerota archaeon]